MGSANRKHDEDGDLVQRAVAGDADAMAALYETHRERVYRIAYHYVHNQQDALDLCQEVFVRAFESLASFEGRARFSTWLMRIATNTCIDHLRYHKARKHGELDEHLVTGDQRVPGHRTVPDPTGGLERQEVRAAIDAAVDRLTPEHRTVFVLHAVEGLTYREIAEVMDCPVGTVMS
ncbi:MAG: RNA polymerase sigma factor, partial [Planctomycetota bacterium]